MRWAFLVVLLAGGACTRSWVRPDPVSAPEIVMQAAAVTLIGVDVAQTMRFAPRSGDWNPAIGPHPSRSRILLIGFALPVVASTAVWLFAPSGWRCLPSAAVIGVETDAVLHNAGVWRF